MVQPMDAIASFTHLTTNLPDWISQIDSLCSHATQKHAEFAAEYTRLLKTARPKRIKSPSITSIHSTDEALIEKSRPSPADAETAPQSPEFPEISPFEAGNRYLYAQARRKRKPTSSVRSGASGPQKFRSKHSVVIYYDSFIQEQLDTMVKNIASARNNVRKGKMSRSLQKGLQLPALNRRFPDAYNSSTEDLDNPRMRSIKSLPTDTKITAAQTKPQADDSCFCQADKHLENAQSLCETAAHQFLRDGDCKLELEGVKAKFEVVLTLATESVSKFQAEKDAEKEQDEAPTDSEATLYEKSSDEVIGSKLGPAMNHFAPSLSPLPGAGAAEIEVDDDEGSSIDVDITKFRSARAAGVVGLRA
jgi:hypothetical protein